MTINVGGTFFLKPGSICRMALMAGLVGMLVPAAGCTSTSTNNAPTALTEGPRDTGSYPNLNIPPQVAAKQLTKEETAANLAQLKAEEQMQIAKGSGVKAPANSAALNTLAKTHGADTLKQIEGKCDPALDPSCN
ncbi:MULTISPECIES: hypothetical protein [unclassified Mesorhizobium]|uniref:hypothetical protein n=1 Tax=unclassified Mesorhizobium TaxID=325217 RepID=UPI001CCE7CC7|nr:MULTISPECIES: hypothetical protein [unclassified Mesorhizobium]MBZ9767997.1 hypothetical protein [Mesorhizobium sp. CA6]MBZ9911394.1 hypothetical protein [Mesorhizobium sp. CA16]